jgi:predicted RNA-binding Zn ribbon-like protein
MTITSPAPRVDEPAPLALVNTIWIDRNEERDALADVAAAHTWVRAIGEHRGLVPDVGSSNALSASAVTHLIDLRDALRRLAADRTKDPRTLGQSPVPDVSAATSIVNAASAMSTVWPELQPDGRTLMRRDVLAGVSFVDALTTMIAQQAIYLVTSPQWDLLRPCVAPGCAYFFMKTRRQEWCSAICGNRARVARHAQRHRS